MSFHCLRYRYSEPSRFCCPGQAVWIALTFIYIYDSGGPCDLGLNRCLRIRAISPWPFYADIKNIYDTGEPHKIGLKRCLRIRAISPWPFHANIKYIYDTWEPHKIGLKRCLRIRAISPWPFYADIKYILYMTQGGRIK